MTPALDRALVLFSGGQDSATCLAWALDRFSHVETIGFDYGQRHRVELDVRETVRSAMLDAVPAWRERLGPDRVLDLQWLGQLSHSALTETAAAPRADGLPATFVPGRNIVFLTTAAIFAEQRGLKYIVTGVCETDYSGYPDCRDDTVKALQVCLNLGMNSRLVLDTPLMWINKAETWRLAERLGGAHLVEVIRAETHSCYNGVRDRLHDWGAGCDACDACKLRSAGWTVYRSA